MQTETETHSEVPNPSLRKLLRAASRTMPDLCVRVVKHVSKHDGFPKQLDVTSGKLEAHCQMPRRGPLPRGQLGHLVAYKSGKGGAVDHVLDPVPFAPPAEQTGCTTTLHTCTGGDPIKHHPQPSHDR
jgi:hypothetical protein